MSLTSLKRDISKIKRKLGIDFEKLDYEGALKRHNARFDILYAEKIAPIMDQLEEIIEELDESEIDSPYDHDSSGVGNELRQEAEKALELLGGDTSERWQNDQETLVAYHLKLYGNLFEIESQNAFGSTPDATWANYESNIAASKEKEEENKRLYKEEKEKQRAEMEKEYGKPVRLHPDFSNNTLTPITQINSIFHAATI